MFALVAAATAPASAGAPTPDEAPSADARALIESCSAHKFETTVDATVDGQPRRSKVKLCGKPGQTDADWAHTLEDAVGKIAANPDMPTEVKAQITTALTAELARLAATAALPPAALDEPAGPAPIPLPVYSVLPPPTPVQPTPPIKPVQAELTRPRLTITCLGPLEIGEPSRCTDLEPKTQLTVRADEALEAGILLRFVRRGAPRGDVALPAMRAGELRRFVLPGALCSGILNSRIDIQIIRGGGGAAGRAVATEGPFSLHC